MKTCTIVSVCEAMRYAQPNPKDYETMSVRLARSIRNNGGRLKDCDIVMWYGEDVPPKKEIADKLRGYGCRLVSGTCAIPTDPTSNQFTASNVKCNTDYVMWVDCDSYVNGDLGGLMEIGSDVSMIPDHRAGHTWASSEWDDNWDLFYKYFNVEKPPKILSLEGRNPMNFYYNNAITLFKNGIGFAEMWEDTALKLLDSGIKNSTFMWWMVATTLAVLRGKYSLIELSEDFNYAYAIHGAKLIGSPSIIHYQGQRIGQISDEEWIV